MKFKIGDKVKVLESESLFYDCEGIIIDIEDDFYVIDLYKGNERLNDEFMRECLVYLSENDLEKIIKLDVKRLREEKNTQIISTEESLKDVEIWFNNQMEDK